MNIIASLAIAVATLCTAEDRHVPIVESGDIVQIGDFQFVIISKGDYDRMWVEVCDLKCKWNAMNSNETGRVSLHGKRIHTTITNETICAEYADGYKHFENTKVNSVKISSPILRKKRDAVRNTVISKQKSDFECKRETVKRLRSELTSKTNNVSVVFGR